MGKVSRILLGPGGRAAAKALKIPEDKLVKGATKAIVKGGRGMGKSLSGGQ